MRRRSHYVTLQGRGILALPAVLRRRYGLDQPGAQMEIVERDDGILELHPHLPIPASQRWFWTERWQRLEREVDAHVAAGETRLFESPEQLFEQLDAASAKGEVRDHTGLRGRLEAALRRGAASVPAGRHRGLQSRQ